LRASVIKSFFTTILFQKEKVKGKGKYSYVHTHFAGWGIFFIETSSMNRIVVFTLEAAVDLGP